MEMGPLQRWQDECRRGSNESFWAVRTRLIDQEIIHYLSNLTLTIGRWCLPFDSHRSFDIAFLFCSLAHDTPPISHLANNCRDELGDIIGVETEGSVAYLVAAACLLLARWWNHMLLVYRPICRWWESVSVLPSRPVDGFRAPGKRSMECSTLLLVSFLLQSFNRPHYYLVLQSID